MFFWLSVATSSCFLVVLSPSEVNKKLGEVQYSLANFGNIPFGQIIVGPLIIEDNQACDSDELKDYENYHNAIVLVMRGNCTFVTKVRNAEKHGAKLVIIQNNQVNQMMFVMADDGFGYTLNTPSIFINNKDGQSLRKYQQINGPLILKVNFSMPKYPSSQVKLLLDLSNRMSFVLANQVYYTFKQIKDHMTVKAYYSLLPIPYDSEYMKQHCYGAGQYCAFVDPLTNHSTGQLVILQILRQIFILNNNGPEHYLHYMKLFNQHCEDNFFRSAQCSKKVCGMMEIDYDKLDKKVNESFVGSVTDYKSRNYYLEDMMADISQMPMRYSPTILVNNVTFSGSIKDTNIQQAICASIMPTPKACKEILNIEGKGLGFWTVFLIIAAVCLLTAAIFFLTKRIIRSRPNQQQEIKEMVTQYAQFYSKESV